MHLMHCEPHQGKSTIFRRLVSGMQRKCPGYYSLGLISCFLLKIIEKSVLFVQSCITISFTMLILPFHNFFLHSTSKIPQLSFSDFISARTFLSLISFLCIHCFTNFWLAYNVCTLCVSSYQSMFMFRLSCKCNFPPCLSEIIRLYAHQCYIMNFIAKGCWRGQECEWLKKATNRYIILLPVTRDDLNLLGSC